MPNHVANQGKMATMATQTVALLLECSTVFHDGLCVFNQDLALDFRPLNASQTPGDPEAAGIAAP